MSGSMMNPMLLLTAARDNDCEKIRKLAENGVPVMLCNQIGQTALHVGALWGHPEAVKLLIDLGSDVNVQNMTGSTPLHFAAGAKKQTIETVRVLLDAGADETISDTHDRLPWELVYNDNAELKTLLGAPDPQLFVYAAQDNTEAVRKVLLEGVKGTVRNPEGGTMLHVASKAGHVEMVSLLLTCPEVKADLRVPGMMYDHNGFVPLHLAAAGDHAAVIKFLVETGADVNETSYSSSEYAGGNWVSEGRTLGHADQSALHIAVDSEAEEAIDALLQLGAQPDAVNFNGETPLSNGLVMGDIDVVRTLLAGGANPDKGCKDFRTPLHHAALACSLKVVQLLLDNKADPNIADDGGWTPLLLATRRGKVDIVNALIRAGADVACVTKEHGNSALHLAAINKNDKMVEALVAGKCRTDVKNCHGETPRDVATGDKAAFDVK